MATGSYTVPSTPEEADEVFRAAARALRDHATGCNTCTATSAWSCPDAMRLRNDELIAVALLHLVDPYAAADALVLALAGDLHVPREDLRRLLVGLVQLAGDNRRGLVRRSLVAELLAEVERVGGRVEAANAATDIPAAEKAP